MKSVKELMKCRICGREGVFTRLHAPYTGRIKKVCWNEDFIHGIKNGEHVIINTSDEAIPAEKLVLS